MPYLVDVAHEDYEDHNYYCDTYEEAVEYAKRQNRHYCGIYKLVAEKNEYTNEIKEVVYEKDSI